MIAAKVPSEFFDLEDSRDLSRLDNPFLALKNLTGLVIIDEIQRKPAVIETLRVLVDQPDCKAQFLLLGSAAPRLIKGASESLAGRIGFVDLSGFNLSEIDRNDIGTLWSRGGFPRSFLATSDEDSVRWRNDFVRTFLERDIPNLGISIPAETLRRFWTMIARSNNHDFYFWATHSGAELDLLLFKEGKVIGFEIKYMDAPSTTKSMRVAIEDLQLEHLYVVYPGEKTYQLDDDITVLPLTEIDSALNL